MSFNPNAPAGCPSQDNDRYGYGFTKRDALIKGAFEALLANPSIEHGWDGYADRAIRVADALIERLSKEPAP